MQNQQPNENMVKFTVMPPDFCPEIPSGPKIQQALDELIREFFPEGREERPPLEPTTPPVEKPNDLLDKARAAKNGAQFVKLYDRGDTSDYPSASEADQALANMLAFWTGGDENQIDSYMRQSALLSDHARLKKWDTVHVRGLTYGQATIHQAIQGTKEFYDPEFRGRRRTDSENGQIPEFVFSAGDIPNAVENLQDVLKGIVYQMGGVLVYAIRLPQKRICGGVRWAAGSTIVAPLDADTITLLAAQRSIWKKFTKKDEEKLIAPPAEAVRSLLAAKGQWKFPVLNGLVSSPILRADGSVLQKEGYDQSTGVFADFGGQKFKEIPVRPTQDDAFKALGVLLDALSEFPFVAEVDRSVALAALLTTVIRRSIPTAPMFGINASTPGTGKSALGDLVAIVATGKEAAAMDYAHDDAEFKKAIFSVLLESPQVVMIDNVVGELNNSLLNIALTQQTVKGRILGASKTAEAPATAVWLCNGNNLQISGDLTRRSLLCNLDAKVERPAEREFSREIYTWAQEHRPQLVEACLTVLKAHHAAGMPGAKGMRRMNGFNEWSKWVRASLRWLGMADPLDSQRLIEAADPERENLAAVLSAWWDARRDKPTQTFELAEPPNSNEADGRLYQALLTAINSPKGINGRSIGKWLTRYQGRICEGFKLVNCGKYNKQTLWKVELLRD